MSSVDRRNHLLRWYLIVWGVFFLLLALVPAQSLEERTKPLGYLLTISYLLISAFVAVMLDEGLRRGPPIPAPLFRYTLYATFRPDRILPLVTAISLLGLALHLYDKLFITGIDFAQGIASARHQWIAAGAERETAISSWQSAAGHILTNFNFAVVLLCVLFWEHLRKRPRRLGLATALLTMLVYAATMGSRSVPFVFLSFLGALILLRKKMSLSSIPGSNKNKATAAGLLGLLLSYALFVFQDRARLSGASIKEYALPFFYELGARETAAFDYGDALVEPLNHFFYMMQLVILYLVHSQWTFDYILTLPDTPGGSLFNMIYSGLNKLGFEAARGYLEDRAFKGVLLTLPGSIWYDFGFAGFFLAAPFHGVALFLANRQLSVRPTPVTVLFFIMVAVFSLLSPLSSAANLMVFPFMAFALLIVLYSARWLRALHRFLSGKGHLQTG